MNKSKSINHQTNTQLKQLQLYSHFLKKKHHSVSIKNHEVLDSHRQAQYVEEEDKNLVAAARAAEFGGWWQK